MALKISEERFVYITPEGIQFLLDAPPHRSVLDDTGLGMPPIEYVTSRGPFQHGETMKDFWLRPRIVQMTIRHNFCNRKTYWDGRADLLNVLRPNRSTITSMLYGSAYYGSYTYGGSVACQPGFAFGTLRKYYADRRIREIAVMILEGPKFEPRQRGQWDEWSFQEVLRFIAFDPIIYDPLLHITNLATPLVPGQLVFPITFPIVFSGSTPQVTALQYSGTWMEFPVIELVGPMTNPMITNDSTGETLQLLTSIPAGTVVTICTQPGNKTILGDNGVNYIGFLSADSDLTTFHLAPDPEAPGGLNQITAIASAGAVGSAINLKWYNRYIGM